MKNSILYLSMLCFAISISIASTNNNFDSIDSSARELQDELRENDEFNEILEKFFQLLDFNGDGLIGLEEYLKSSKIFCEKSETNYDEESDKKDFIGFDENSDNSIDISEFKAGWIKKITEDEEFKQAIDELGEAPVSLLINPVIGIFQGLVDLYEDS